MSNYKWRDSPDTISRLINANDIQTFANQQVMLKPNEVCVLIVDGKIGDILTETHLKSMAGGFSRWLGDKVGLTASDRRLLFAMSGPMDYWVPFEGQLSNGESAKGFANLRLKMNTEDVPKLLNYFANNAPVLDRNGLINIIRNEVIARVVTPCLASCSSAADLRGAAFLEQFEMTAEIEMRNLLANLGFTLLKSFPITNPTDMEMVQKHRATVEAQTTGTQVNTDAQIAHYAQTEAITLARIQMENNVKRAHAKGQVTVELEHDLKGLRAEEARWDAELNRDKGKMNLRVDEADAKAKRAMDMFSQVQARKADRVQNQNEFQNQRMAAQNELQSKMMEMAADHGALTPEVMAEFLRQQTAQKAVDNSKQVAPTNCSCGISMQPGWKACPGCGSPIA